MAVEMLDFISVIKHVVAYVLVVRPIWGDPGDVDQPLDAFGYAAAIVKRAVRLDGSVPEAPRRIARRRLEEIGKVARIVAIGDALRRRLGLAGFERAAGHQSRLARFVIGDSRPPA